MLDGHQIRNGTLLQVAYNYYGYKQTPAGRYAIIRNSTAAIDCIFLQWGGGWGGSGGLGSLGSTEDGPRFAEREFSRASPLQRGGTRREWLTSFQIEPFNIFHGIRGIH